jgi:predicted nuclease of restriction endonuclease-like RecB superfamily
MLTGKLVRVRHGRNRIIPCYLDTTDPTWQVAGERLLDLFRSQEGRTRAELEEDLADSFGDEKGQVVVRGLAKLLEDRCEFEVVSGQPPEKVREVVFRMAAALRQAPGASPKDQVSVSVTGAGSPGFDRTAILRQTAAELGLTPEEVDRGLFADLKSEQRLIRFKDISSERLLQRYNVALAQAVLLRSTRVQVNLQGEPPQRYRQLLRLVKFHRLICEIEKTGPDSYSLLLDGPLSLFSATQKYGLQLALFLPAILLCRDFELTAELYWGPQRRQKAFSLSSREGLVSHLVDSGMYVPPELEMFVDLFRKKIADWDIAVESEIFPLGDGFWIPDFRLTQRRSGRSVYLEVLGFWRRASAEAHLRRLRDQVDRPFVLAVSDGLRIDDAELEGLPAGILRFRQMPLPDEVARLAEDVLRTPDPKPEARFLEETGLLNRDRAQ